MPRIGSSTRMFLDGQRENRPIADSLMIAFPYYSKTRIGKERRYLLGSTNAVKAANLYSAPRSEYGLLA